MAKVLSHQSSKELHGKEVVQNHLLQFVGLGKFAVTMKVNFFHKE
jgi:hypothetical protein